MSVAAVEEPRVFSCPRHLCLKLEFYAGSKGAVSRNLAAKSRDHLLHCQQTLSGLTSLNP